MTQIQLAFGKQGLSVALPDGPRYTVLEAKSASALADPARAIESALDSPIGCPPLREMTCGKQSAAISVCDITRPAPNQITLPPILRRLEESGIRRENISIHIATGLHRPATTEEIETIVGTDIAAHYRILNHHARELGEHRYLGQTSRGTPVYIDEGFIAADLHHHAGVHRTTPDARLLGRPEVDRPRSGRSRNHQGAAQSDVHARAESH